MKPAKDDTVTIPDPTHMRFLHADARRKEYAAALRTSIIKAIREEAPYKLTTNVQVYTDVLCRERVPLQELLDLVEDFKKAGYAVELKWNIHDPGYGSTLHVVVSWKETP